jgi:hypothetical protein
MSDDENISLYDNPMRKKKINYFNYIVGIFLFILIGLSIFNIIYTYQTDNKIKNRNLEAIPQDPAGDNRIILSTPDMTKDFFVFYDASEKKSKHARIADLDRAVNLNPALESMNNNLLNVPGMSYIYSTSQNTFSTAGISDFGRNLINSNITGRGGEMFFMTTPTTFGKTTTTSFGRQLLATTSLSSLRGLLALTPGTNVQAFSSSLASIASLNIVANKMLYSTGVNTFATTDVTDFARTNILNATDGSDLLSGLGAIPGVGPVVDNSVPRFNGIGGSTLQPSLVTISDTGDIVIPTGRNLFIGTQQIDSTMFDNLYNSGVATITEAIWGYVESIDQELSTGSNVAFDSVETDAITCHGEIDMDSSKITNLLTPSSATDAATKAYVDTVASGTNIGYFGPVKYATVAALPACTYSGSSPGTLTKNTNGAVTFDGVTPTASDIVLVKNQVSGLQNGFYIVTTVGNGSTPFVLTRTTSTYYHGTSGLATLRTKCFVTAGNTLRGTGWISNLVTTIGVTDPIIFTQTNEGFNFDKGISFSEGSYNVNVPGTAGDIYINPSNQVAINGKVSISKGGTNNDTFTNGNIIYSSGGALISSTIVENTVLTTTNTKTLINKTLSDSSNNIAVDKIYSKTESISDAVTIGNKPTAINEVLTVTDLSPMTAEWVTPTIDINGLTEETSAANGDFIAVYDISASSPNIRKMTRANFLNGHTPVLPTGSGTNYIVAATGGDHTTIQAAVAALTSGGTITVYPGTYVITTPLNPSNNTKIIGVENVIITNSSDNGIFEITGTNKILSIKNLTLTGTSSTENIILIEATNTLYMEDINLNFAEDTDIGLYNEGVCFCDGLTSQGNFCLSNVIYNASTLILTKTFLENIMADDDTEAITSIIYNNGEIYIDDFSYSGSATYGISFQDSSFFYGNGIKLKDCINGIYLNGTNLDINISSFHSICTNDIFTGDSSDGTGSSVNISGYFNNLNIDSGYLGILNLEKNNNREKNISGLFTVGNSIIPTNSYFGQGLNDSFVIQKYNASTYTAVDNDATFTMFDGLTSGYICYIGDSNPFYSIEMNLSTALSGTTIVCEYYNGSAWTALNNYSVNLSGSNVSLFSSTSNNVIMRLNYDALVLNWATTTINSLVKYWVRFRLTNNITTSPAFTYIKVINDSLKITDDGRIEKFGKGETSGNMLLYPLNTTGAQNINIVLSSNLNIPMLQNRLTSNSDKLFYNFICPKNTDYSRYVTCKLRYCTVTSSSADLNIVLTYIKPSLFADEFNMLSGGLSETTITNTITPSSGDDSKTKTMSFNLDLSSMLGNKPIYFSITRSGTFSGTFTILDTEIIYSLCN